jgi:hypothetical protein
MITTLLLAAALSGPPAWSHCHTYEEPTLRRWHSVCTDGTRATHRYNATLRRWETTVQPPARPPRKESR